MNNTMATFGYPATLIKEYTHWCVLLRPVQVTLGSLVLACKDPAQRFSAITADAFAEQATVVADIERVLGEFMQFEKMNYMMLMMVDPDVHYHVLPRYEGSRSHGGSEFLDAGWPALPRLDAPTETSADFNAALVSTLRDLW